MPRSINHLGTPYKYQLTILLQKAELLLSNPLGKLSFVFRVSNQRFESLQKHKVQKQVILNESLSTIALFYETDENNYEESILHLDLFLNQIKSSKIIGVSDIDLTPLVNQANRSEISEDFDIIFEKSPEYKAKLSLKIGMKCLGVEIVEKPNFSKKRGHSNLPIKTTGIEEIKSEITDDNIENWQKNHLTNKTRSITPTPSGSCLAKQITRSQIIEKKNLNLYECPLELDSNKVISIDTDDMCKSEENFEKSKTNENFEKLNKTEKRTKYEKYEKKEKNEEKKEKPKKAQISMDNQYNLKTPPSKKEIIENISTIQPLSETMNSTNTKPDFEDNPKKRDTFGYKSTGFNTNSDNLLLFLDKDDEMKKLDSLKQENMTLLKEKVRLENLLVEIKEVKKSFIEEQDAKIMILAKENSLLKNEIESKDSEFNALTLKTEEMKVLLEEKQSEVKRLEDLASGLQKELLFIRKELTEKSPLTYNKEEEIEELKGQIEKLEIDINEKNNEKSEILRKKEEEFKELKKANENLMENNTKLQQNLLAYAKEFSNEKTSLKDDVRKLEEHKDNIRKEIGRKEVKIQELEENLKNLQAKFVKTKEEVADIVNLVFEKGGAELMEEIEGYMVNLSEISKEFEMKLSEKRLI